MHIRSCTLPKCWITLSTHFWWLLNLVTSIWRTRTSLSIRPWCRPTSKIKLWKRITITGNPSYHIFVTILWWCCYKIDLYLLPRQRCFTALNWSSERAEITSFAPCLAASTASAAPIPVDAPVIQITFPFKSSSAKKSLFFDKINRQNECLF